MGHKISFIFCMQCEAVRSGANTVPGGLSLLEIMPEYRYGLALIDSNSLRSASVARAANDGKSTGRKLHLRSLLRRPPPPSNGGNPPPPPPPPLSPRKN